MTQNIIKFEPQQYVEHVAIADASCFYFAPFDLTPLIQELNQRGNTVAARWGRIEVSDAQGTLHWHRGATFVFVSSGYGSLQIAEDKIIPIRVGDLFVVPPRVKHLSIAAPGTTLIEQVVYISAPADLQAVHD